MKRIFLLAAGLLVATSGLLAETREKVAFGDFEHWVTRTIKESAIIGGKSKTLYEIGPTQTIHGNKAYRNLGGSPWATSNVYAKVAGVVKGSNAVFPAQRAAGNKCVKAFNNHGEGEGTRCGEYGRIGFGKHLLRHNGGAGEQHQKSIQQTGHERKVHKTP